MIDEQKKISVIIPVYNMNKYLTRCLDSIVNQTYSNLQIICVNDASTDDSPKIINEYAKKDPRICIVNNKKNLGLFHTRIEGLKQVKGDYVSFVDSDDYISLDYYRCLIEEAQSSDADIVFAKVVEENEERGKYIHNLSYFYDFDIKDKSPFEAFFEQKGLCYIWHTVWNKLYKKELWDSALPYFEKQKQHLIMTEDVVFSSVIFYFAKKISHVDYSYYFYFRHKGASTGLDNDSKKFAKNIFDQGNAFSFVRDFLSTVGCSERIMTCFDEWKNLYARIWFGNINSSNLKKREQKKLLEELQGALDVPVLKPSENRDHYFYSLATDWNEEYYNLQNTLIESKCEYYSFDIFDTLIFRPFLFPDDLFSMLEPLYRELFDQDNKFSVIRKRAEALLRESSIYSEITLDEIYDHISEIYLLDRDKLERIKNKEIELEISKCYSRQSVLNLFKMLLHIKKKTIIVSDIYLDYDTIKAILDKNGIVGYEKLFLSSVYRKTKQDGSLYGEVLKQLKVLPNRVFHIGDNYDSDYLQATRCHINAHFYSKAINAMQYAQRQVEPGAVNSYFEASNSWLNMQSSKFMATKCALAICANKLFDNPYIPYDEKTNFNCNSQFVGYFPVGMFLLGTIKWINENGGNYDKLHFIGRDGYLFQKAYELFYGVETNYLELSRKALLPLVVNKAEDIMLLNKYISWTNMSPYKIISILKPILNIDDVSVETSKKEFFVSESAFNLFLKNLLEKYYDDSKRAEFQNILRRHFQQIIGPNNNLFDIGYSGRSQIILTRLLGYPIDGLFVHIHGDENLFIQKELDINIKSYYDFTPSISGGEREYLFSKQSGSLIRYKVENGTVEYVHEDFDSNYADVYCIQEIQQKALSFIKDFKKFFSDDMDLMFCRNLDISIPFEILMHNSPADIRIFDACVFEDDLFIGKNEIVLSDLWKKDMDYVYGKRNNASNAYNNDLEKFYKMKRWKKAICYFIMDRKLFKQKWKAYLERKKNKNRGA